MRGYFGLTVQQQLMTGAAAIVMVASAGPAMAQTRTFDVPAGPASRTIPMLAKQAGVQILASGDVVRSKRTRAVRGSYSVDAALRLLLEGTGLEASGVGTTGIITIRASSASSPRQNSQTTAQSGEADAGNAAAETESAEILVTGTRIHGAPVAAPVIVRTRKQMQDEGQTNLGDFARSLPQSFNGGQNPGVTSNVVGQTNVNVGSGSSFNLRGLGPDATLTLLNGHRLAYDGGFQAVDVSAIPIAAIDRVEIVADGASAIYGSDAVGGVANIILKRDYNGLVTSIRFGSATEGGDVQQEYSAVAGKNWGSGGIIVVGDYSDATRIAARQRPYTAQTGNQTILPAIRQYGGVMSAHQEILPNLRFSAELTYNHRSTASQTASNATSSSTQNGTVGTAENGGFSATPRLDLTLGGGWEVSAFGTYARGQNTIITRAYSNSNAGNVTQAHYENETKTGELTAQGPLFTVFGNQARLAVGGGYRSSSLVQDLRILSPVPRQLSAIGHQRGTYYAYGELFLPVLSPDDDGPIRALSFSGAVRYEKYDGMEGVATPKFGVIFEPFEGLELKSSWGESFKAPTLYQQNVVVNVFLYDASMFGPGYPSTGLAMLRRGGNADLRPERAESWTFTATFRPQAIPGLTLEASYYDLRFRDRVVNPVNSISTVAGTPALQPFVTYNPTPAVLAAAVAEAPFGITFGTTKPYDPANVVVLVDGRNTNATTQNLRGVDLSGTYQIQTRGAGKFVVNVLATYLDSKQTLLPGQAPAALSGTTFDPPKWRARGGLTWSLDGVTLNGTFNYIGPLSDDRFNPAPRVGPMRTVDATLQVRLPAETGPLAGVDISFSALNLLNERPRIITTSSATALPYDSTNHSAIGRFVNFTITKEW